jgi:hypothetical protein
LWVALPALASPWTQSQKTAHVPALLEATRVFDGQQVCQRRDGPYGWDLFESGSFRIPMLGQALDLDVHLLNLDHELFDLFQQRSDAGY